MPNRLAGILALIAFAVSLLVGTFDAGNAFTVVVYRGLLAMLGTYVVGYLVGIAAERMLAENVAAEQKRLEAAEKNAAATEEAATDGR
jgi:branched-subunit amino acid ABC-type transport system permease component